MPSHIKYRKIRVKVPNKNGRKTSHQKNPEYLLYKKIANLVQKHQKQSPTTLINLLIELQTLKDNNIKASPSSINTVSCMLFYLLGQHYRKKSQHFAALVAFTNAHWLHATSFGTITRRKQIFSKLPQRQNPWKKIEDNVPELNDILTALLNTVEILTSDQLLTNNISVLDPKELELISNYRLLIMGNEALPDVCDAIFKYTYDDFLQKNPEYNAHSRNELFLLAKSSLIPTQAFYAKEYLDQKTQPRGSIQKELRAIVSTVLNGHKDKSTAVNNLSNYLQLMELSSSKKNLSLSSQTKTEAIGGTLLLAFLLLSVYFLVQIHLLTLLLTIPVSIFIFSIAIVQTILPIQYYLINWSYETETVLRMFLEQFKLDDVAPFELPDVAAKSGATKDQPTKNPILVTQGMGEALRAYYIQIGNGCNPITSSKRKVEKNISPRKEAGQQLFFTSPPDKQETITWDIGLTYDPSDPDCKIRPFYDGDKIMGYIYVDEDAVHDTSHPIETVDQVIDEFYQQETLQKGSDKDSYKILTLKHGCIKFTGNKKDGDLRLYGSVIEKVHGKPGQNLYVLSGIYNHKEIENNAVIGFALAATEKIKNKLEQQKAVKQPVAGPSR